MCHTAYGSRLRRSWIAGISTFWIATAALTSLGLMIGGSSSSSPATPPPSWLATMVSKGIGTGFRIDLAKIYNRAATVPITMPTGPPEFWPFAQCLLLILFAYRREADRW